MDAEDQHYIYPELYEAWINRSECACKVRENLSRLSCWQKANMLLDVQIAAAEGMSAFPEEMQQLVRRVRVLLGVGYPAMHIIKQYEQQAECWMRDVLNTVIPNGRVLIYTDQEYLLNWSVMDLSLPISEGYATGETQVRYTLPMPVREISRLMAEGDYDMKCLVVQLLPIIKPSKSR